jgi:spore coat protein U-like protein
MKLSKILLSLSAMTAMFICLSGSAAAQTAQTQLPIAATVNAACNITTLGVSFGVYSPLSGTETTANGSVTITCTKDAGTSIELNQGLHGARNMSAGGADLLSYELHRTSVSGPTWGSSAAERLDSGPAPDMAARTYTVYGRIPPSQVVAAGSYTDSVTATVNF